MEFIERLKEIQQEFESGETPQEIIDVLNAHVEDLLSQNPEKQAVSVGETAPSDLPVWSTENSMPLANLMGDAYMVLTWFRGNW